MKVASVERIRAWMGWIDDVRLSRINHIRSRAGQEPLTREQAARLLANMTDEQRHAVKERIA